MERANLRLMVLAVLVVLIRTGPVWAFSGSGSGTESDPYVITDVYQLQEMADDLDAYYILGNDIDASDTVSWSGGQGFEPVGTDTDSFYGTFDGQGHTITDLHINRPSMDLVGLFGCIRNGAEIKNVGLSEVDITARRNSGSLVGGSNGATVCNSWSSGNVRGSHNYQMRLGGLLGISSSANSYVYQCFSSVNVTATGGAHQVGGLSGYNGHGSIMSDCYATGNVSGYWKVGGLVGDNPYPEGGYITRCYSTGKISGIGGGLVGFNFLGGVTYDSYWDVQTSGKSSSHGGTGKTTAQMMQQATFVNWDFDEIWDIDEGQSYPYFMEPRTLVGLEIEGSNEVAEDFSASYKAIAHYDIGSTKDVTDSANWSVEPNDFAAIAAGLLTTEVIDLPEDVTITAEYTEGPNTVEAQKQVSILTICPSGSALEFDGENDYAEVSDNPILSPKKITLSAWIYPEDVSHDFQIIGKWVPGDNEYIFDNKNNNDTLRFVADIGVGNSFVVIYSQDGVLTANVWQHVAVTWDGSSCVFYVNGNNVGENNNYSADLTDSDNPVCIGSRYDGTRSIDGLIDEVAIFNSALSAEEIQVLMHTRPDTGEPNLVAYWDFDEGEGQVAGDSAGGNHGTLGSAPDVDSSDPNWVDSVPPVGICTMEGLVERNISNVLDIKADILELLDIALGKEDALLDMLNTSFKDRDFGTAKKGDVVKAKQKIFSAIQAEEQAETAVGQSIEKLDDALDTLDIGPQPGD